jgi:hypothetical protein
LPGATIEIPERTPAFLEGLAFGLTATLAWALYSVGTSIGRADGFSSADLAMLRYGVAAVILAPSLLAARPRSAGKGLPPARSQPTLLIGPPFALFINAGYSIAPLYDAVVLSPSVKMLVANALATLQTASRCRAIGKSGSRCSSQAWPPLPATSRRRADHGSCGHIHLARGPMAVTADQVNRARISFRRDCLSTDPSCRAGGSHQPPGRWLEQTVCQRVLGGALAIVAFVACMSRPGLGTAALFLLFFRRRPLSPRYP